MFSFDWLRLLSVAERGVAGIGVALAGAGSGQSGLTQSTLGANYFGTSIHFSLDYFPQVRNNHRAGGTSEMLTIASEAYEKYLLGVGNFVVSPEDNPDCVPFYRAWRGMENVVGKEMMSRWHYLVHEAVCWGSNKPIEEQFQTIVGHLRYMVERWQRPEEPRYSYSYACAPSEPTEHDARQFFNDEYKRAFPGKRANSKDANRLWKEKRDQAFAILRERHNTKQAEYEACEQEYERNNVRRREEWIEKFWSMALFEEFVRGLEQGE